MSAESVTPVPPAPPVQIESVGRGALFALAVVPVGVGLWVLLWSWGFIASLVAAAVAYVAVLLYIRGARGFSRVGAVVALAITVLTLALAFFAGIVFDAAQALGEVSGLGTWGAFVHEGFWPTFWEVFPEAAPDYLPDLGWAVGFGALGAYAALRTAFSATSSAGADQQAVSETESDPEAQPSSETV